MKRIIIIITFSSVLLSLNIKAQNVQLFYDFGSNIYKEKFESLPKLRGTFEMFKLDNWGSTYFFVDLNFASEGVVTAYSEISRQLKFWQLPLAIQVEYNGGLNNQSSFEHAALAGATYTFLSKDYSKMLSLSALYKYIHGNNIDHSFQLTCVWELKFCDELMTFSGCVDYWMEDKSYMIPNHCPHVVMMQPQFWVNINKFKGVNKDLNLSLGFEVDLSLNAYDNGFFALPAVGTKWSF